MPSERAVRKGIGSAEEFEALIRSHEVYREQRALIAPPKKKVARDLTQILREHCFGYANQVADAAAAIASTLDGETSIEGYHELGQALVLLGQSYQGITREAEFQQTVRYLLAHNGYQPVTRTDRYDFFLDTTTMVDVFALPRSGTHVKSVKLKSKRNLNWLLRDFGNLQEGTTKKYHEVNERMQEHYNERKTELADMIGASIAMAWIPTSVALCALGNYIFTGKYIPPGGNSALIEIGIILGGILPAGVVGGDWVFDNLVAKRLAKKLEKRYNPRQYLAKSHMPYSNINRNAVALIDAFSPLENPVFRE